MCKKTFQYKRNDKGALVRDKEIIVNNDIQPRTIGGLIKKALFDKGAQLLVLDK
jgi:hypothetical protein